MTVEVVFAVNVVVVVGAVKIVEIVFEVMLRQLHAEVKRAGGALYWGRQTGGGEVAALALIARRFKITLVASGPTMVTGVP